MCNYYMFLYNVMCLLLLKKHYKNFSNIKLYLSSVYVMCYRNNSLWVISRH